MITISYAGGLLLGCDVRLVIIVYCMLHVACCCCAYFRIVNVYFLFLPVIGEVVY